MAILYLVNGERRLVEEQLTIRKIIAFIGQEIECVFLPNTDVVFVQTQRVTEQEANQAIVNEPDVKEAIELALAKLRYDVLDEIKGPILLCKAEEVSS